jgi:hypothetical protein
MNLETWASLVSVVVAIVAVFYAGHSAYASRDSANAARDSATAAEEQARAVEEQTQLRRDLRELPPNRGFGRYPRRRRDGTGPRAPTGRLQPEHRPQRQSEIRSEPSTLDIQPIIEIFERGIASVAPGRTMEWVLGAAHNVVDWDAHNEYKVRIEADGPFGSDRGDRVRDHRQRLEGIARGCRWEPAHGCSSTPRDLQQLYTMLTRGRSANHLYVSVVGDGGPAQPHPARDDTALHRDRAARTNPWPRPQFKIGQHPAARAARPRRPAGRPRCRALP